MANVLLEGLFAPITSCFYPDGRPYWRKLEQNVEHYSRSNLSGLVILGSNGEAAMLSDEEARESLRVVRAKAAPEKVLVAGVARESVIETLRLAEYAAALDYDAVLVHTPQCSGPQMGPRELLTYFRAVADHASAPVVLSSGASSADCELPVPLVMELAMHANIIGIEDRHGKANRIREIVDATKDAPKRTEIVTNTFQAVTLRMAAAMRIPEPIPATAGLSSSASSTAAEPDATRPATRTKHAGFQVLGGSAETFLDVLECGGSGGVIPMAAFAPQAIQEIYTCWKEHDQSLAIEKQRRVVGAAREICSRMGVPGVKHALDFNGYFGGRPRLPLLPLTAEQQRQVEDLLMDMRN